MSRTGILDDPLLEAARARAIERLTTLVARALRARAARVWLRVGDDVVPARVPDDSGGGAPTAEEERLAREVAGAGAAAARPALAGAPLVVPGGAAAGALCVAGEPGRAWSDDDRALIADFAAAVAEELGARAAALRAASARGAGLPALVGDRRRATDRVLRTLIEASPLAIVLADLDRRVRVWNATAERLFGWTQAEALGAVLPIVPPELRDEYESLRADVIAGRAVVEVETQRVRKDGTRFDASLSMAPLRDADGEVRGIVVMMADITERKGLAEQLRGAQRMEAVGQLAGGIAHDFNNLLTAIKFSSDLLLDALPGHDERRESVEEIVQAADRAAALTRQLLAFSRRQVLQPQVLDLNDVVVDIERMLGRLIGEDIEVVTVRGRPLGAVRADRAQLEQVLVNLAVNARDAMPHGGVLIIETANVAIAGTSAERHPLVPPGDYVMLAVTDTGHGMDAETRARIFEPFFTTKEPGKGTGLGLSTVYGIVKQSGGFVFPYSEPGYGTTFKIYLPRVHARPRAGTLPIAQPAPAPCGSETLLLVEDEAMVRSLMRRILERAGYRVLEARHGREALTMCETHPEPIHLVVTDVVMPEMGGRELAEALRARRPGIRVLFTSGYTGIDVVRRGFVGKGAPFLQKPITPAALTRKIREVLDEG